GDGGGTVGKEGMARSAARQHGADYQPLRQEGRHILGRMHRDIDGAGQQGLLDLLGEEALAAGLGQAAVADAIAAGRDWHDRDRIERHELGMSGGQGGAGNLGLSQRQRAAAAADSNQGTGGHAWSRPSFKPWRSGRKGTKDNRCWSWE